ncbi:hypothetical protein KAI78_01370 [bacterium]|nr:hypothetical protein [bacterium]
MKKSLLIIVILLTITLSFGVSSPSFRALGTAGIFEDYEDLFQLNPAYMAEFEHAEIYANFFNGSGSLSLGFLGLQLSPRSRTSLYINAVDQSIYSDGQGDVWSLWAAYASNETESEVSSDADDMYIVLGHAYKLSDKLDAGLSLTLRRSNLSIESVGVNETIQQTTPDTYITTSLELVEGDFIKSHEISLKLGLSNEKGSGAYLGFSYSNSKTEAEEFRVQDIVLRDSVGIPIAFASLESDGAGINIHKIPEIRMGFRKVRNFSEKFHILCSGLFSYTFTNSSDYEEEGDKLEITSPSDTTATTWTALITDDFSGTVLLAANTTGRYELAEGVWLGASLFYSFAQPEKRTYILDYTSEATIEHDDGDVEVDDPDDYVGTYTKTIYEKRENKTVTHNIWIPIGLEVDLSEKVTLRMGTLHSVIWNITHTKIHPGDSYTSEELDVIFGDASETSDSAYQSNDYDVKGTQMVRATYLYLGFLWKPAKNLKLEINLRELGFEIGEIQADFAATLVF